MAKVIKADGATSAAFARLASLPFVGPEYFVSYELLLESAALTRFITSGGYAEFTAFTAQSGMTNSNHQFWLQDPVAWGDGPWAMTLNGVETDGETPTPTPDAWMDVLIHVIEGTVAEITVNGNLAISASDADVGYLLTQFSLGIVSYSGADAAAVIYYRAPKIGTTEGGGDVFEWNGIDLSQFTVTGDVSVVDDPFPPPPPPPPQVYADLPWRGLVTDTGSGTLTVLDHRSASTELLFTLGAPASCTGQVAADDPEINLPYPDADSPAYLTNNRRLLYMLRREPPANDLIPPYVCRFGGIIMSVEDEAGDAPTTRFVAYDPWQLLMNRPVRDPATHELPGENGLTFRAADNWRWNEIITNLLDVSFAVDGEHHIETFGTSYPLVEECEIIASDITFSQGLSLGEAWQQMVDTGYVEILLPPIYDPFGSPGKVTQIAVAPKVGSLKADVIMGWDVGGNTVTDISRLIDGTRLANRVAYFAGQVAAPIQSDAASRTAYGDYFSQQHFPDQEDVTLVAAMAFAQLTLRKNGAKTLNFGPAPERSDLVLRDYGLGDYVAVWASRNLRDPIHINYDDFDPDNPGACGYQRVFSIPIQIDNSGVTKVVGIATADERAGGSV